MKTQIYLPDDLGDEVKAIIDLNVSAVCRAALHKEIARRLDVTSEPGAPVEMIGAYLSMTWADRVHQATADAIVAAFRAGWRAAQVGGPMTGPVAPAAPTLPAKGRGAAGGAGAQPDHPRKGGPSGTSLPPGEAGPRLQPMKGAR